MIRGIQDSGLDYRVTAGGTIAEKQAVPRALAVVERARATLQAMGWAREYVAARMDIGKGRPGGRKER